MSNKILILALVVALTTIAAIAYITLKQGEEVDTEQVEGPSVGPSKDVIITTDKTEYERGETIKITVRNGLNKSIWYIDGPIPPLAFWNLERFVSNTWKDIGYEYSDQLPVIEEGREVCRIFLFEVLDLAELKPNSEISHEWNQKICLFDREPFEPKLIDKGHYRFTFTYGLGKSSEDPQEIVDKRTIYSNEFLIR
jgi:hypothetical protein